MKSEFVNSSSSGKVEIINHFDALINRVDIDIEEFLEKYNEHEILGDLECFEKKHRNVKNEYKYYCIVNKDININNVRSYCTVDLWTESTKVVDYLNQIRLTTIEELRKAQDESLDYYKLNLSQFKFKSFKDDKIDEEELKSKLFDQKFYFQIRIRREKKPWIFNLYTFRTDFYISQSDIDILEKLCNNMNEEEKETFSSQKESFILDEKMLRISLLFRQFIDNLTIENYPSHVIFVSKQDILDIEEIKAPSFVNLVKLNSLSNLQRLSLNNYVEYQEIELDGLSSLIKLQQIKLNSLERFSARNLTSLKHLSLDIKEPINENMSVVFESVSAIISLHLKGSFSNLNLDSLVNLEDLELNGKLNADFNNDLFKNLCNHLQRLASYLLFNQKQFTNLFYRYVFPSLRILHLQNSKITKLEKKFFQRFETLQTLNVVCNNELQAIDSDAFSSLSNLVVLNLNDNFIEKIDNKTFSSLIQLKTLNLRNNYIEIIEDYTFLNLKNLTELDLSLNIKLCVLNAHSFVGLENLQKLDLGYCKLSIINPQTFIGLRNLKNLNLRNKELRHFDLRILNDLSEIEKIYLSDNCISNKDEILESCQASKIHFC